MSPQSALVLGSLDPSAPHPFGPGSTIRRVVGEPIVNLLYPRALIMEVAHPSVGAAVRGSTADSRSGRSIASAPPPMPRCA